MSEIGLIIGLIVGIFFMLAMFLDWFAPKDDPILNLTHIAAYKANLS